MCFSCICLFILHALIFVLLLCLLVSGVGCGLWLWHSLDFSINLLFSFQELKLKQSEIYNRNHNQSKATFRSTELHKKKKWAPSSEFVSSSIPSWQILSAHAQPFRGARDLAFCMKVPNWLTACMSEQRRFWRDCANAQARLNLRCSHRR